MDPSSGSDAVWRECVLLGQCILPLVDQESWRQSRRHDSFHERGIDSERGEKMLAIFASAAMSAVTSDAVADGRPASIETLYATPLSDVAHAVVSRRDYEILAGLPDRCADSAEGETVAAFRLLSYQVGGQGSRWLFYLSRELHRALGTLTERSRQPSPTCGDLHKWATRAGLVQ
ncbi:hypothetical protein ACUJ8N_34985 [Streptomyces sp. ESR1.13]|uniref:hypothetical protein n=1 Tax=unclassified Streptomyces TaxID=2593676 RepID=UPI004041F356